MRPLGRGRTSSATALTAFMSAAVVGGGLMAAPAQAAAKQGTIRICKSAKNGMARPSSFTLNGGAAFKPRAEPAARLLATRSGPNTVVESPGTGVEVAKITASDVVSKNLSTGTVVVNVKAGTKPATAAVVTYVNRASADTAQTGYIEVCKRASDSFVTGSFDFTITAPGFNTTRSVLVGQCTEPNITCPPETSASPRRRGTRSA